MLIFSFAAILPGERSVTMAGNRADLRKKWGWGAALILKFMSSLIRCASSASSRLSIRQVRGVFAAAMDTSIGWNISWRAKTRLCLDQGVERMLFPRDFSVGIIRSLAA